ncbi:hypothetical protein [Metabacillus halosaccharovorans]|uniref:hypothetical protein n=1 Tax=Metabacillus halosaccharovorans TaxID=930124 RepID=UPI00203EF70B|nr:hypothetical protein [Metabacillus halosaccharovorans]MCM3442967.1 hypothetical protein [Metabacillus halosaccharovorans]
MNESSRLLITEFKVGEMFSNGYNIPIDMNQFDKYRMDIDNKTAARGIANLYRLDELTEKVQEMRERRESVFPYDSDEKIAELEKKAKDLILV